MILSGPSIREAVALSDIGIKPFNPMQVNPVSYDLRLGSTYRTYKRAPWSFFPRLDAAKENPTEEREMDPKRGLWLWPLRGYLMHTHERIVTDRYVPVIDGKSSIGRLFVWVHVTAGFGDPGFDGQYTLEVVSLYPVRLYPGMRICQVRFHTVEGPIPLYDGQYKRESARGAVASRSWKQVGT